MKKYKVKSLSVGGQGNKIYYSGDIVSENNFKAGRADELVAKGFLSLESEETHKEHIEISDEETKSLEGTPTTEEISKEEIIKDLIDRSVVFDPKASKKSLYKLWLNK